MPQVVPVAPAERGTAEDEERLLPVYDRRWLATQDGDPAWLKGGRHARRRVGGFGQWWIEGQARRPVRRSARRVGWHAWRRDGCGRRGRAKHGRRRCCARGPDAAPVGHGLVLLHPVGLRGVRPQPRHAVDQRDHGDVRAVRQGADIRAPARLLLAGHAVAMGGDVALHFLRRAAWQALQAVQGIGASPGGQQGGGPRSRMRHGHGRGRKAGPDAAAGGLGSGLLLAVGFGGVGGGAGGTVGQRHQRHVGAVRQHAGVASALHVARDLVPLCAEVALQAAGGVGQGDDSVQRDGAAVRRQGGAVHRLRMLQDEAARRRRGRLHLGQGVGRLAEVRTGPGASAPVRLGLAERRKVRRRGRAGTRHGSARRGAWQGCPRTCGTGHRYTRDRRARDRRARDRHTGDQRTGDQRSGGRRTRNQRLGHGSAGDGSVWNVRA